MISCLLIDHTHRYSLELASALNTTAGFRLIATFGDVSAITQFQRLNSDTPIFYVVGPSITDDLAQLRSIESSPIILASENMADAALAFEHEVTDFLQLPFVHLRFSKCLEKLTKLIQQANKSYTEQIFYLTKLTKTQRQVLRKIGEQKTTQQIAAELFVSTKTIDTHRANIRQVLCFDDRRPLMPLAILALEKKLI